jgi:hypothetical protein
MDGWNISVLTGYAVFRLIGKDDSYTEHEVLEFSPGLPGYNDIFEFSVTAAPSSFGRFGQWAGTLWAVDGCEGEAVIIGGTHRIIVRVKLAIQGNNAGLARVAFTLIIKGHLKPTMPS